MNYSMWSNYYPFNYFHLHALGLGVLLVMLPLNAVIWYIMEGYQVNQMKKKDERVRLITEILNGIKVLAEGDIRTYYY